MKKILISTIAMFLLVVGVSAQGTSDSFKPNGKPVVTIFSDFTNTTTTTNSVSKTVNAFELSRAYFGYAYNFSPDFSAKVVFDIANSAAAGTTAPGVSAFTAFLKNAFAEYSSGMVKADLGMIGTNMFSLQESIWGKRYLYKSFQDQYGLQSSADLGAKVNLQFIPELSLDLAVFNGEGYKKVQADSTLQFSVGLTAQPIKNLYARVYYDYLANQKYATAKVAQSSFDVFLAYKADFATIGAEYNTQTGNKNTANHDLSGMSVWATVPFAKQFSGIVRYDNLMSKNGWNTTTDGSVIIAGIEYAPVKGIQITPNFLYSSLTSGVKSTSLNVNLGVSF